MKTQNNSLALAKNELLPISVGKNEEPYVNARDLHRGLQSDQDFSDWIKNRLQKYGFKEGEEFSIILWKNKKGRGRKTIDYHLTLDTAKELAMVEATPIGQKFRRYFIAVEKDYREKRLYGLGFTLTDIRKQVSHKRFRSTSKEILVYRCHQLMRYLGYKHPGLGGGVRERYGHLMYSDDVGLWVDEDFVRMKMRSRAAYEGRLRALDANPLLPPNPGSLQTQLLAL